MITRRAFQKFAAEIMEFQSISKSYILYILALRF